MILLLVERLNWCHNHLHLALEEYFPNSGKLWGVPKTCLRLQNRTQIQWLFFGGVVDGQRFGDMLYSFLGGCFLKYDLYLNPLRGKIDCSVKPAGVTTPLARWRCTTAFPRLQTLGDRKWDTYPARVVAFQVYIFYVHHISVPYLGKAFFFDLTDIFSDGLVQPPTTQLGFDLLFFC